MNLITRKHLSRRTLLRGVGAAIALPMMDAMRPAFSAAKRPPTRLAFLYVPNGIIMKDWTPAATGRDFEFTRILKPLEPYRKDLLVLTGLEHHNANALGDGGGDHARAGACFLTGVHPRKTMGADISAGISADQIAGAAIGSQTRFATLELGCDDSRTVGGCDSGYSCAYTNSISWRGPATPMPPEINPRVVFERLFGSGNAPRDPEARASWSANRKSVLDLVREDTARISGRLGAADRRKIDEYLYAVREIEKQIENAEKENQQFMPDTPKPSGIPDKFDEYLPLMMDLQLLGFRADLTRISTLVVGREGSRRTYPEIGVPDPHHPLTHHRNDPEWIERVSKINCFHAELFARYVKKLGATEDGDGRMMDRIMLVYASAIADGNRHTHEDLPALLAGRANGAIQPGRHIRFKEGTPMTNLYMTLLDTMGVKVEKLGDSTGKVEGLSEVA